MASNEVLITMIDFNTWNVVDLRKYLVARGVTCSDRKVELVKLCELAHTHKLEIDPDCSNDVTDIGDKLHVKGVTIPHPNRLVGSPDFTPLSNIDNFDIYNYLIKFKDLYNHKQLKAFTHLDGYQLFVAGYVQVVELVVWCNDVCVVKFSVKPKQRSEDPINKTPFYHGWIVVDNSQPEILSAYCACKGGADGGCRHVVAVLFELAELTADRSTNTQAVHHIAALPLEETPTKNMDNPLQTINELITALPGSSCATPPTTGSFDPWPEFEPDVDSFYTG